MAKYRTQKYCACQLISAINARIFLGGDDISDELFEELVDLVYARNGSALQVNRAYPALGLKYINGPLDLNWIKSHLPVELVIYSGQWGFHSVLVHKVHGDNIHVLNNQPHHTLHWPFMLLDKFPPFDYQRRIRSFVLTQ